MKVLQAHPSVQRLVRCCISSPDSGIQVRALSSFMWSLHSEPQRYVGCSPLLARASGQLTQPGSNNPASGSIPAHRMPWGSLHPQFPCVPGAPRCPEGGKCPQAVLVGAGVAAAGLCRLPLCPSQAKISVDELGSCVTDLHTL